MTVEPVLDAEGKQTGEFRYQGAVANRALELLGKEIGMFIDRSEQGKPGEFSDLSDEELERRIRDDLVRAGIPEDIADAFVRAPTANRK
jgi:phage terminase small subunit